MRNKAREEIISHTKLYDDCRFIIFGINTGGGLEHYKCYTYLECNETISEKRHLGYKNIEKIKI